MSFPDPRISSQQQQPSSHFLPYYASRPPQDVNVHHMQRPLPAPAQRIPHVARFPHHALHNPPPPPPPPPPTTHIHQLPISYPQPAAQSQPPRYVYSAAVPPPDSNRSLAQPPTTSRSVSASHGALNAPSYAPASHPQYAPKMPTQMYSHILYPQQPPSDPHGPLHSHVVQTRPHALPSPVPTKPAVEPHQRVPPHASQATTVNARPFVGPLSKDQFVDCSSRDLDYTASKNDNTFPLPLYSEPESVFFSVVKPEIPTREYMKRLVTYTHCSPSAFILMLVYLDRVAQRNKKLAVTPYNMHRLLITALTLACKNLDDQCYANAHYAKVGGIPTVREMNRLELQFLKYLEYNLFVKREEHEGKIRQLGADEPNSPTSINGQSFSPPRGPPKMGFDREPNNTSRTYGRVVPMKPKTNSEFDSNRYELRQGSKSNDNTVAHELNSLPEIYEKTMRSGMPSVYGAQRRMGYPSVKRCNMGVEAMDVVRTSAPIELPYVTSATARGNCRP